MSSKHKKSSRTSRGTPYYPTRWSEWTWNKEYQCNARYREVSEGQWEWDYDQTSSAGTHEQSSYNLPVEDAPYTPRDRSVDPSGLPRVEEEGQQEYRPENYRHDDPVSQVTQRLAGATIDPNPQGQSYEGQPYEGQPYEGQPYEGQPYEGQPYEGQPYEEEHHGHEEKKKGKGSSYSKKGKSRAREASHEKQNRDSYELDATTQDRYPADYGSSQQLESTSDQHFQYSISQPGTVPGLYQSSQTAGTQVYPNYSQLYAGPTGSFPGSGFRPQIPSYPPQANSMKFIRTRDQDQKSEKLDKRFVVHKSKEFYFGRVFKVLWSEPQGAGGTEITVISKHGQKAFHKVRRFLITSEKNKGHSICIPILTYGLQGLTKPGVHPEDHAVVYSSRRDGVQLLPEENRLLMKSAIRIEMDYPSEKLDPLSRMNYAKLYTVEHNVKVFFIGRIAKKYERDLMVAYNEVHPPYTIDPQGYIPGSSENLASHTEQDDPGYDPNYRQEEGGPSTYPAYDDGYAGD